MSQGYHVAAGRYVTQAGQKFSKSQVGSGPGRARAGFRLVASWGSPVAGAGGVRDVTTVENLITYPRGYGAQV
jgi:hypothetical protein